MKDIEKIIEEVNGTMSMEGMPITADDRNRIRLCLRDKKLFNETLKDLIHKHSVPKSVIFQKTNQNLIDWWRFY